MKMFSDFSDDERKSVKFIVSDVDDTITTDGALYPEALDSLYRIRERGLKTTLVTGGSSGWADAYIRQWPVDAVIAESGAVLLFKRGQEIIYKTNPVIASDPDFKRKRDELLRLTCDYPFSSDQYARIYDVAYERSSLDSEREKRLFDILEKLGATALVSSIHVNVLFSDISKKKGIDAFYEDLKEILGIEMDIQEFYASSLALGDSVNDEALFEAFPMSVGNKRVLDAQDRFSFFPRYVTSFYGGESFSKVIGKLLER